MGKNKDKKAKRTSDVLLQMTPYSSYVHESPQQLVLSTDTESSVLGSPSRPDMLTCSSKKKKQKKRDLDAQECENKSSEFQIEGEQEHGKKPVKRRKSRDCETPSNKPAEFHLTDMVDGLAAGESHHEEPKRKKKKKDKQRPTEETVTHDVSKSEGERKKKKKKRFTDKVEEMNMSLKSDENEMMSDERTEDLRKKKKKKKKKEHHLDIFESAATSAQSVQENGVNASRETGEKHAENLQVKKKKDKKKDKEKILGSEQLVKGNGSTDFQETKDMNVSTESEQSPTKKGKKKTEAKHKNGDLKTQQTQTIPKRIDPKTEETDEWSVNEQVGTRSGQKKKRGPTEVDPQLLEELKHFVPKVESKVASDINRMINYDLPRFKEFKRKGIPLNSGRFTVSENKILEKNVEDFLALTGIDSGTKLFFTDRFEEKGEIKKLKKNHRFFEAIAEGIPRSCHDVYTRGRKIFDGSTCKGTFTKSELHQLCKLQTLHGNDWKKISELTGRSPFSLEKRYSQLAKKAGVWSEKESQRLLRAVREYIINEVHPRPSNINSLQVSREMLYKGLPWRSISEKVKTRSWNKCREKWLAVLAKKMSSGAVCRPKLNNARTKLIKAMYQMQVEDVSDVNWDELSALFGDVPPSYVQKKFNKLKLCYVPNWQSKSFADIIDFLYEKVLPCLEANVSDQSDHDFTQLKESQAKSFLFSDLFQDINDQDTDEEEEEAEDKKEETEKVLEFN